MEERDKRTLYCGNLSDKVTEELLYELFLQAGPLEAVKIPKDKSGRSRNYAFITFRHDVSVPYTIALMQGISLFGRELKLELRSGVHQSNQYLNALIEHRRLNSGPVNASTPTDYHRQNPALDRKTPYGNNAHYPDSRGSSEFLDHSRRSLGTPHGARSFSEGSRPQQIWQNGFGFGDGFNQMADVLRYGISPVNFIGDAKMRSFDDRLNMTPRQAPIHFRDRKYH